MRLVSLALACVLILTADASAQLFQRRANRHAGTYCQSCQSAPVVASGCQGSQAAPAPTVPGCLPATAGVCSCGPDCPCPNCPNKGIKAAPKAIPKAPATPQPVPQATAPAIAPALGRMMYNARTGQWVYCATCPQSP